LDKDLNFHPYKIVTVQELNDRDVANRRMSSKQLLEKLNVDAPINTFLITNEAHFLLSGYVNKQNYRHWAAENPQKLPQRPLQSDKLTVWCGISSFGVLGPYLFEDNEGAAVTVTSQHRVEILRNFCEQVTSSWNRSLFSMAPKDGATAHTARVSLSVLRENVCTTRNFSCR
jgi:hypothetical protein